MRIDCEQEVEVESAHLPVRVNVDVQIVRCSQPSSTSDFALRCEKASSSRRSKTRRRVILYRERRCAATVGYSEDRGASIRFAYTNCGKRLGCGVNGERFQRGCRGFDDCKRQKLFAVWSRKTGSS